MWFSHGVVLFALSLPVYHIYISNPLEGLFLLKTVQVALLVSSMQIGTMQKIGQFLISGMDSCMAHCICNYIRVLQFVASSVILGVFSYYISLHRGHHLPIAQWIQVVEALSAAATFYTLFGSVLTFRFGGIRRFAYLAMLIDALLVAAMIAIAVMTRDGTQGCIGNVSTPVGGGSSGPYHGTNGFEPASLSTYLPNLVFVCRLEKTVFAFSIVAA
jgi:hypothetical protein